MQITLDLKSVAAGAAAALTLGLVAGFSPQATQRPTASQVAPRQATGLFSPHPSQLVHLSAKSGSSGYDSPAITVPPGKILVLTGVTVTAAHSVAVVSIDGEAAEFSFRTGDEYDGLAENSPILFGSGVPITEGQTVQVLRHVNGNGFTWAFGYWADA